MANTSMSPYTQTVTGLLDAGAVTDSAQITLTPLIHPLASTGPTGEQIAQQLGGLAITAANLGYVAISDTNFPFMNVTQLVNWEGSTASMRGSTGSGLAFANPGVGVTSTGISVATIEVYGIHVAGAPGTTNHYTDIGPYDVLGWNATNIVLGAEPFNDGSGYSSYLLIHNATLNPKASSESFPLTIGQDPSVVPDTGTPDTNLPPGIPFPCYLAGTRIATARGEIAVEQIAIGDLVRTVTDHGESYSPVIWVGQRDIDAAAHPEPSAIGPVRIRAHAFGEALPARDLLLSPDHAIFVDGVLIPARLLINGGSIVQDMSIRRVRYVHVELDRHGVMLAEGLPAESYLAGGNRAVFARDGEPVSLHPSFETEAAAYANGACARLALDEATVLPVWTRLAERGGRLGMASFLPTATTNPGVHLVADGRAIAATADGDCLRFVLPAGTTQVRLASRHARPADTRPWLDDRRQLGVMVTGLVVQRPAGRIEISLTDDSLAQGWWAIEAMPSGAARWTDGLATLRLPSGATALEVRIVGEMSYPMELPLAA